jgi:hypothetical protein
MAQYIYQAEEGRFNLERLMDELVMALTPYGEVPYLQGKPDGSAVIVEAAGKIPQAVIEAVIAAHDPAQPGFAEVAAKQREAARDSLAAIDPDQVSAMPPDQLAQVVADLLRLLV